MIYHLVTENEYLQSIRGDSYVPASLSRDGFAHCALDVSVASVAKDYYSSSSEILLLLRIAPEKLAAQTKYEAAKPGEGAGTEHERTSSIFPHVYGPINNSAISGVGILRKDGTGYVWPQEFEALVDYLDRKDTTTAQPEGK